MEQFPFFCKWFKGFVGYNPVGLFLSCLMLQAELILELQKQLTLLGNEPKENVNGGLTRNETITSMISPVDKVCSFF